MPLRKKFVVSLVFFFTLAGIFHFKITKKSWENTKSAISGKYVFVVWMYEFYVLGNEIYFSALKNAQFLSCVNVFQMDKFAIFFSCRFYLKVYKIVNEKQKN